MTRRGRMSSKEDEPDEAAASELPRWASYRPDVTDPVVQAQMARVEARRKEKDANRQERWDNYFEALTGIDLRGMRAWREKLEEKRARGEKITRSDSDRLHAFLVRGREIRRQGKLSGRGGRGFSHCHHTRNPRLHARLGRKTSEAVATYPREGVPCP